MESEDFPDTSSGSEDGADPGITLMNLAPVVPSIQPSGNDDEHSVDGTAPA